MASAPQPAPTLAAGQPLTIGDLLAACWRRRWLAGGVGVAVAAAVIIGLLRQTPLYEAEARLAVDRGRKAVEFQSDPESGRIEFSLLNTQRDMLQSAVVLRQALEMSGAAAREPYAGASEPIEVLRKRLRVATSRDSWVIQVSMRDEDAAAAGRLLQAVLDAFLQQQAKIKSDRATGALNFLSSQVAASRERLEQARAAEQEFRARHGIVSTDQQENQPTARLRQLSTQLTELDRDLAAATAAAQQVAEARALPEAERTLGLLRIGEVNRHPVVVEQQQLLYELEDRRTLLAQKFLDAHPRMLEVAEQIQAKRGHLAEAVATACSSVEARRRELQLRRDDMVARIAEAEAAITAYRGGLIQLTALEEERRSRERLAEQLLKRLGEEEVASRLDTSQVVIVDPPQIGVDPVNIRRTLFLAAGALAGAVAAIGAALAAEALDRRVRGSAGAAEASGLAVIGQVPDVPGLKPLGRGGDASKPHELAEAFSHLRAALRLTRRGSAGCTVYAVTSTGPSEGKSTVAARLAIALAATGVRTCLIDADLRRPTAHHQLGEQSDRGLSFALAGEPGIEPLPTSFANLDLLPVGVRPPNPAELLHRGEFPALIARLRGIYGAVVIDTPPLGLVSDALAAGEQADGVLVVVRDRTTFKGQLRRVVDMLQPLGDRVLGIVVNAERAHSEEYGYGYGYRYRYRYGDDLDAAGKPAKPTA
jgi:succinoglycan biosynthesis transport protein ExoP